MSYIGYTPWKKFKKLLMLSKAIIKHYGFNYFFYVVKAELRKQGFSVFHLDAKPLDTQSNELFQEQYTKFIESYHDKFNKKLPSLKNLSIQPKIKIIVMFDRKNISKLNETLNSLKNQTYSNWSIVLYENISDRKEFSLDNVNNIQNLSISKSFGDGTILYQEILDGDSDLIGFVNSGDVLDSSALHVFVQKFNHNPSIDIFYSDNDAIENNSRKNPFFKPDWSPYLQNSMNYLSSLCLIKKDLIKNISMKPKIVPCLEYDIILKCIEQSNQILHIPLPLCSVKQQEISTTFIDCQNSSLISHLKKINVKADVKQGIVKNTIQIKYDLLQKPKISIIIPTKNNLGTLKRCINSIQKKTKYSNFEIIIVDNNSTNENIKNYYESLPFKILTYAENFNFSKMNNLAVEHSTGDFLLFLNDDTKILDPFWLDELISICLQADVGIVGPKLILSDDTIQHAGMVFLPTGAGFHPAMRQEKTSSVYHNTVNVMKDCSAVTGACLLIEKKLFKQIGGFDNKFDVYYGDSDLCFKVREAGFRIIYTPFTELLHEGSMSISYWHAGASFFDVENHQAFIKKWPYLKQGDPFYNPNLDWDYSLNTTQDFHDTL